MMNAQIACDPTLYTEADGRRAVLLSIAQGEDDLVRALSRFGQKAYPVVRECRKIESMAREFAAALS